MARLPRLRLTLRLLLLVVAAVAAMLGWQLKRQRDIRRAIDAIEAKGGMLFHADELLNNNLGAADQPSWFRQLTGEDRFVTVTAVAMNNEAFTDEDVDILRSLPSVTQLTVSGSRITDAAMSAIARLPNLTVLDVTQTKVTAAGLEQLKACKKLGQLHLSPSPGTATANDLRAVMPNLQVRWEERFYGTRR
jgi:Leucine-rich repeat (LRR) protein